MDFNKHLSKTVQQIKPSGIRKYFDITSEMADAISLGIGEPDFITPMDIRQIGIDAFNEGKTKYTANRGIYQLREELSHYLESQYSLRYNPEDEILITVGASEAIDIAIRAVVDPGDEVLIAEPCFVSYSAIVTLTGGIPVSVVTHAENDFKVRPEDLEGLITDKTKAFILSYPNNPTGAVMTREDLAKLVPILEDKDIVIITDEIYSELTYGPEEHTSIASFPSLFDKTIYVSGFSKAYAMTGWRLGYVCANPILMEAMAKIHQYLVMSAPTVSQYAAAKAITNFYDDVLMMRAEYDVRRQYIVRRLNKMGLTCFEPKGAFYCFPSIEKTGLTSEEFCDTLLEKKRVAVIPGTAFGECGKGHVRISYAYSLDVIHKAMDRIEEFMREY
jgi:aminotransferase